MKGRRLEAQTRGRGGKDFNQSSVTVGTPGFKGQKEEEKSIEKQEKMVREIQGKLQGSWVMEAMETVTRGKRDLQYPIPHIR